MELKNFFAQDLQGNVIPSPTVTVYLEKTTTLATGLNDKDGNALTNPFTGGGSGQVTFAAPDGNYDLKIEAPGRVTTMRVRFIDSVAGSTNLLRNDLASSAPGKGSALVAGVGLRAYSEAQAKLQSFYEGERVYITDRGNVYKFSASRYLIARQAQSEITFDDTLHILVTAGGLLQFDDWSNVRQKQGANLARFAAKLKDRTSPITLDCYGDSITFGQALADTAGATNKIGSPTYFGDGSVHGHWQFNDNYPAWINTYLYNNLLQSNTVNNFGFSGDRAISGYLRHRTTNDGDAATIMYGVNDCLYATSNGSNPSGLSNTGMYSVESYTSALRLFAAKQIMNGKAVTVLGTAPFASIVGFDGTQLSAMKLTRAYNAAAKRVADEFGCRFVDVCQDVFTQYGIMEITQEGVHLGPEGLKIAGERIAAALVTIETENRVSHGSILIANPNLNCLLSKDAVNVLPNVSTTPKGTENNERTCISVTTNWVSIPFYAESSGLVAFINGMTSAAGATFEIKLDDGAIQSDFHFQHSYFSGKPASQKQLEKSGRFNRENINITGDTCVSLHVTNKGWHTISIRKVSGASSLLLDSISFKSIDSILSSDVYGTTAKAVLESGSLNTNSSRNIYSIDNLSTGFFDITFNNPMQNNKYVVAVDVVASNSANIYRVTSKTANGFTVEFMSGAGTGSGIHPFQGVADSPVALWGRRENEDVGRGTGTV